MTFLNWYRQKLVRRQAGPYLLLSFFTVCLLSSMTYFVARDIFRDKAVARLKLTVDLHEVEMETWVADQKKSVIFIARTSLLRERIAELLTYKPDHFYHSEAFRNVSEYLYSYIKNFDGLREIMILSDHGGKVLFSTNSENEGEYRSGDTFFRKGQNALYVQGVYPWRETAEPTITISRPLLDANGVKTGVLAVHLDLERLDAIVGDHPDAAISEEAYLVDKYNTFVSSERFGRHDFPRGVHSEGIDRAVEGKEGFGFYPNYIGVPVVGYYRWNPELEVAILAEISQEEAFAPARQLGFFIAGIGFVLNFLLLVATVLLSKKIAQPILAMSKVASDIAAGDFTLRVPVLSQDETGELARAFNSMIAQVNIVYDELRDSATHFRSVFQLSPDAIGVQRAEDGVLIDVNDSFCKMFDFQPDEAIGVLPEDLNLWADKRDQARLAVQLRRVGQVKQFEARFRRKNGELFEGLVSSRHVDLEGTSHIISVLLDVSDLRKTERELYESRELLQTIMNAIPAPIFFKDAAGVYQECNTAFTEFIGLEYTQIVGHTVYDVAPAEKARIYETADQELLEQGGLQHYEAKVRYADGSDRDVIFHKAVFTNQDREVIGLVGAMLDVSEIKATQAALAESEQNYREIFNASNESIIVRDVTTGKAVDVNQAMLEMFGYPYAEALQLTLADLSSGEPPYTREQAHIYIEKAAAGEPQLFEWQAKCKDGTLLWVEVALKRSTILGQDRILAVARNIEERMEAEQARRESEERFQQLIENAPDSMFMHAENGRILNVNQQACESLGYSRLELLGMSVAELELGVSIEKLQTYWQQMEVGKSISLVGEQIKKDGELLPVEVNLVKFESHGACFFLALARDITERRATEAELERYRGRLEELVRERTSQLEKAQDELVAKERLAVLGQLTATVSHELRNPLGTVKNAIYLLGKMKSEGDVNKMDKALELADRNVKRCDGIINELLDFTRRHENTTEEIDLGVWLQEIMAEQTLPEDIELKSNLAKGVVVSVDSERLRRAFINVFTNGVQAFAGKDLSHKKLSIDLVTSADKVQIIVADNGSGIPADVMARIFEPMFSTKDFGVGLGMSIVKNIMEEHGGGVDLDSRPGEGTSATLWLPRRQELST